MKTITGLSMENEKKGLTSDLANDTQLNCALRKDKWSAGIWWLNKTL